MRLWYVKREPDLVDVIPLDDVRPQPDLVDVIVVVPTADNSDTTREC